MMASVGDVPVDVEKFRGRRRSPGVVRLRVLQTQEGERHSVWKAICVVRVAPKALATSFPMPPLADAMDSVRLSVHRF